jgi:hypothetical protein
VSLAMLLLLLLPTLLSVLQKRPQRALQQQAPQSRQLAWSRVECDN